LDPVQVIPVFKTQGEVFIDNFEAFFETQLRNSGVPGAAVVIVKDTSIVFIKGFGVKEANSNDPIDENTVFRIGSLSKGFTGILAGKLVEQGHLNWEDKVVDYIPHFTLADKEQAQRITIKNILSHTTGLGRHSYTNLIEDGMNMEDIIPKFSTVKVYGKEGEFYAYQNAAFAMIEGIVPAKTNKSYPELLKSEIFDPIGMTNASASYEDLLENSNKAIPHRWSRKNTAYYSFPINTKYYNAVSAGGINASIADMGNWINAMLGNRPDIISTQVLDSVFHPRVNIYERRQYRRWEGFEEANYSMGWRNIKLADKNLMYHSGYVNEYISQIAIDRERKIGICILANAPDSTIRRALPEFLKNYEQLEDTAVNFSSFDGSIVGKE